LGQRKSDHIRQVSS